MKRRGVLSRLGAVAAAGLLAGCDDTSSDPPRTDSTPGTPGTVDAPDPDETTTTDWLSDIADDWGFDRIVDLEDEGADSTGARAIDDTIHEAMTDGTLVYLPPGRYRIEDPIATGEISSIGIVGEDAIIVPPDDYSDIYFSFGWPSVGDEVLFAGIDFDLTAEEAGGRPIQVIAEERVVVRDVTVEGRAGESSGLVRIDVTDEGGTGRVERLSLPDGADPDGRTVGCQVGDENRGDLSFVDCTIAGFPNNGLYADPPEGSVAVLGGTYLNNGVAGVRVESSAESIVRGVHVRCDTDSGGENMRGIRLRAGSDITVEDCVVDLQEVTTSDGAIVFSSELGAGTVRNCRVKVDADNINGIRVKSPNDATPDEAGPFRFENVEITGNAAEGAAINVSNREDCIFENVCIHQPGHDRDGFLFDHVEGELVDCNVSVTGQPLVLKSSSVTKQNVSINRSPGASARSAIEPCR